MSLAAIQDVAFPASTGRPMRAALALGNGGARRPGVIVIHEIFGLNDDIRRITARVADLGYVALAPDLFDTGSVRVLCVLRALLALRRREGPAFADLEAARAWLARRPEVDAARAGVVGFCLGGGFALLYAVRAPLAAAGVFYGEVPRSADELRGVCPVLAGLRAPHDVHVYSGAGHSYMSRHTGAMATLAAWGPMAVGFNADAEADSWRRIEAFFRTHLG